MDTKFSADAKIADASRNYKMQKAGFDQEVNARVRTHYPYSEPTILCSFSLLLHS
jgi:hypothetical protein